MRLQIVQRTLRPCTQSPVGGGDANTHFTFWWASIDGWIGSGIRLSVYCCCGGSGGRGGRVGVAIWLVSVAVEVAVALVLCDPLAWRDEPVGGGGGVVGSFVYGFLGPWWHSAPLMAR